LKQHLPRISTVTVIQTILIDANASNPPSSIGRSLEPDSKTNAESEHRNRRNANEQIDRKRDTNPFRICDEQPENSHSRIRVGFQSRSKVPIESKMQFEKQNKQQISVDEGIQNASLVIQGSL
jgi:hypothetical protein